ncbi:uncharacterized protein DSM5745_04494 [Aspergillus mulundensis]|uniref:Uncharacterized protein n=1 Tax=Aspergillus mulundensis TaxID=1810919 RepID=A0A3D8SEH8_9EURO|nr:hypothetical protein DSM5745_04494 [Aspergillus mulundensis]RDW84168.1 hypothetical protein DSM5745_04494 [Aspergillus mulundensis]
MSSGRTSSTMQMSTTTSNYDIHAHLTPRTRNNPNPQLTLTFVESGYVDNASYLAIQRALSNDDRRTLAPYKLTFTDAPPIRATPTPTLIGTFPALERSMDEVQAQARMLYERAKKQGRLRELAGRGEEEKLGALFDKVRRENRVMDEGDYGVIVSRLVEMGFLANHSVASGREATEGLARQLKAVVESMAVFDERLLDMGGFHVPAFRMGNGEGDHPMEI